MKKLLSASLFLICFPTIAEIRSVHCPLGCPSLDINNNDVAFNHTYTQASSRCRIELLKIVINCTAK